MPAKASGSAIDAKSLVLVRSPGVVTIDLSDGAILLDELSGRSHPLRPSAKLLWACLDGISPLHEICLDIADVLDAPHEQVISDAMAFARVILDEGLATARGDASTGSMGPIHGCELCSGHTVDASVADDARWLAEAPDGCLDSRFPLGRDGEIVARLPGDGGEERLVGIRTNERDAANQIRDRLGSLLAEGEELRAPHISLWIGGRRGHLYDGHVVFRGRIRALRTFSREQAIEAASGLVRTLGPLPAGTTSIRARPLARDGSVVLVVDNFAEAIDAQQRRLSAAGYAFVPHTPVCVDAPAGEALLPYGSDLAAPVFDRVPISHLALFGETNDAELSLAEQVMRAKPLVRGRQRRLNEADLRGLATLLSSIPVVRIDAWQPREVARALLEL